MRGNPRRRRTCSPRRAPWCRRSQDRGIVAGCHNAGSSRRGREVMVSGPSAPLTSSVSTPPPPSTSVSSAGEPDYPVVAGAAVYPRWAGGAGDGVVARAAVQRRRLCDGAVCLVEVNHVVPASGVHEDRGERVASERPDDAAFVDDFEPRAISEDDLHPDPVGRAVAGHDELVREDLRGDGRLGACRRGEERQSQEEQREELQSRRWRRNRQRGCEYEVMMATLLLT